MRALSRLPALPRVSAPSDEARGATPPPTPSRRPRQPDGLRTRPGAYLGLTCPVAGVLAGCKRERERDCVPGSSAQGLRLPGAPTLGKVQAGRLWLTTHGGRTCVQGPATTTPSAASGRAAGSQEGQSRPPSGRAATSESWRGRGDSEQRKGLICPEISASPKGGREP